MKEREALKLALDRLEWFVDAYPHDITVSKEEFLRPFKEALMSFQDGTQPSVSVEQEPVAEISQVNGCPIVLWDKSLPIGTKFYTTPQPAPAVQPLTDEHIEAISDFFECVIPFARAIEAAHGIKE